MNKNTFFVQFPANGLKFLNFIYTFKNKYRAKLQSNFSSYLSLNRLSMSVSFNTICVRLHFRMWWRIHHFHRNKKGACDVCWANFSIVAILCVYCMRERLIAVVQKNSWINFNIICYTEYIEYKCERSRSRWPKKDLC